MVVAGLQGYGWDVMVQTSFEIDLKNFGFSLGIVYVIWIAIILMLYPVCKKFDSYKQNHKNKWWLSYLWNEAVEKFLVPVAADYYRYDSPYLAAAEKVCD